MILKVKKPDYLGESKWEFRYDRRIIDAKMNDIEWLKQFRQREVIIAPGDAIKAIVEVITKYDENEEVISTQYTIKQVIEVIQIPHGKQLSIFTEKLDDDV